ncbi:cytosine deaminase-like metal-dependent hydrolase [Desulfosporosinus orientis DSM 765]|uniref:Cytosine deaminase-like metal-dependent hydrolase n=2 Tax=Desulfosporosinus orientis TaxID=1563 RepID=G7W5U0_DESOD|nr:cytosine deaminase-like metal-dependent hydrolase [Desulfosporosinus orientis DSM 765]
MHRNHCLFFERMIGMSLLIKNASFVITFNDRDEVLEKADVLIEGQKIIAVGKDLFFNLTEKPQVIDAQGMAVLPGLVNTHHHLYQTLFRGLPEVQGMPLFYWLVNLYEFWRHIIPDAVYYGAMVGFSELLRTGCTLTTDHHYVFPRGRASHFIDTQITAAQEIGIRFHATRGSMSLGKSEGGLPPDEVVQDEETILRDSQRLIETYHDPSDFAMIRLALAPCSPFSVSLDLMRESQILANEKGVMLHTHLAETLDEEAFCLERYGRRPVELMEDVNWIGENVWFAHAIHLNRREIDLLARSGSGVAHCPSSNMKLGSGICPTSDLFKAGVKLGIAVDGSASNDGSNMWEEVRRAYLLNHLRYKDEGLSAYETLKCATRGGADVLGRPDTGRIEAGKAADVILMDLKDVAYAGSHDPLVSIVCCGNQSIVDTTIVNGKVVVQKGQLLTQNTEEIRKKAHQVACEIVQKERGLKK